MLCIGYGCGASRTGEESLSADADPSSGSLRIADATHRRFHSRTAAEGRLPTFSHKGRRKKAGKPDRPSAGKPTHGGFPVARSIFHPKYWNFPDC
jgi:hypothetical protein